MPLCCNWKLAFGSHFIYWFNFTLMKWIAKALPKKIFFTWGRRWLRRLRKNMRRHIDAKPILLAPSSRLIEGRKNQLDIAAACVASSNPAELADLWNCHLLHCLTSLVLKFGNSKVRLLWVWCKSLPMSAHRIFENSQSSDIFWFPQKDSLKGYLVSRWCYVERRISQGIWPWHQRLSWGRNTSS